MACIIVNKKCGIFAIMQGLFMYNVIIDLREREIYLNESLSLVRRMQGEGLKVS